MTTDPEPPAAHAPAGRARTTVLASAGRARTTVLASAAGAAVVLVVAVAVSLAGDRPEPPPAAQPTAAHPAGVYATTTPTAAAPGPFAGTPAATYPAGAAGITLPPPDQLGPFTAEQVADALTLVKQGLIAGRLDQAMLVDRDPGPFLSLLAPRLRNQTRADFVAGRFRAYATQIAADATPGAELPRVSGRVTYRVEEGAEGSPVIEVVTNFVWVYAFTVTGDAPGGGTGADDAGLVVVHDELTWQVPHPDEVSGDDDGLMLSRARSSAAGVDCDQYERGYVGPSASGATPGPAPVGAAVFDPDQDLDLIRSC